MAGEGAYDGPRWKTASPIEVVDKVTVPTFIVGGLHDIFQRGEPLLYERLKNRVPTRLLIGPWTHTTVGEGLPADGVPAIDQIALRWLDNYLKGIDTDVDGDPEGDAVHAAATSTTRRRPTGRRPEPRAVAPVPPRRRLPDAATPPSRPEPPETLPPEPGLGRLHAVDEPVVGRAARAGPVHDRQPARRDERRRPTRRRRSRRTCASPGPLFANLWVTTTASDAVVSVRVTDVAPGRDLDRADRRLARRLVPRARPDAEPLRRRAAAAAVASVHEGLACSPVTPGEPIELPVEIFPTNAVIKAGHSPARSRSARTTSRMRFRPLCSSSSSLGGIVQVLHDPQHPSYVALPTLGTCPKGCKPLPVANLIRG